MTPGNPVPVPPLARPEPPSPICLVGPTAVGKSAVALALAQRIGGEIISADSMQVYRGLEIGTSKPTAAERAAIPHHLVDVVGLGESFDAARFVELARLAVADIQSRGHSPIICGGTGLYVRAWLEGLGESPPPSPALRAELEAMPLPDLCRELEERDPVTFQRIDRANRRRLVRALEVIRLTDRPYSAQRAAWSGPPSSLGAARPGLVGLGRDPADLRRRIETRVEAMFAAGLVRETERLLERGLGRNRTAMQALGYRQVVEYLEGQRGLPETIARVKTKTWQFARRQMTWFRRQLPLTWLRVGADEPVFSVLERVLGHR